VKLAKKGKVLLAGAVLAIGVTGAVVIPASAGETGVATDSVTTRVTCKNQGSRTAIVYTTDRHGPLKEPGGYAGLDLDIDKMSKGYRVCAGIEVGDKWPDGRGVAAYATYDYWDGSRWYHTARHLIGKDPSSEGPTNPQFSRTYNNVANFYVYVCRYKGSSVTNCSKKG
jgi:hypothetical protein